MVNHMAEVAKMLGVELGEKFTIIDSKDGEIMGVATINDIGFTLIEYNVNYTNSWHKHALENLLTGAYSIKSKPWKPKDCEDYWVVDSDGEILSQAWLETVNSYSLYKLGNCYRTCEEAEANKDKWIKFYASDEVLEV